MPKAYSLSTQATYILIGKIFSSGLAIFLPVLLVRIFTPDEYGIYQQTLLISMTLVEMLKWGLINSLFYFYPLAKEKAVNLLSQTFYLLAFIGAGFFPILYLLRFTISSLFNSEIFVSLVWPVAVYIFCMLVSLLLDSIFVLEKKSKVVVLYEILHQVIRIALIIGVAVMMRDVYFLVWGITLFSFIRASFLYIYLKKNYQISLKKVEFSYLFKQLKYAFPIGSARFVGEIGKKIDKFIVSGLLSPAHFALYAVANLRIPFINVFYQSIGNVVILEMTKLNKKRDTNKIIELWHKTIVTFAAVTIPAILLFSLLAEPIITLLFTRDYIDSVSIYKIFLLVFLGQIIGSSFVLRACKETKTIFKSHLYAMITAVMLSFILIKFYGMVGGAFAFVISSYVRTTLQVAKVKKILALNLIDFLPWSKLGEIALSSLLIIIIPLSITHLNLNNLTTIAISGLVYTLIMFTIFVYIKVFSVNKILQFAKSLA